MINMIQFGSVAQLCLTLCDPMAVQDWEYFKDVLLNNWHLNNFILKN